MSDNSLNKFPYQDGKAESFRVCISKIEAYAGFVGVGDAIDPVLMKNCPTWSELAVLDVKRPDNQQLVKLYQVNKKLCTIIALGQGKSHGMAIHGKTKMMIFPMD